MYTEKTRISMTDAKRLYPRMYQTGAAALHYLLSGVDPRYYNAGVYGWNNDIYTLFDAATGENIAICAGYRNMRGKEIPYNMTVQFEKAAEDVKNRYWNDRNYTDAERERDLEYIRTNFINALRAL